MFQLPVFNASSSCGLSRSFVFSSFECCANNNMRNRTILVFENSEFESEDRPRHLTLQNVQLHICPTVCIGCLNLSWARHYAFCYCWKAEAVVLRRTQEMEKSLSLGFYCSNYLHCCFLASRSIIHQKIAVMYFWSSYLLWLGILFEIKRRLFARCSLFVIFEKSHRNWGTKSVTREGVGSDQWKKEGKCAPLSTHSSHTTMN